jgi:2-keto-4-pentenoate hydratase/2-oxohepta-3-ene-1,7-dioic acid hydratase in catechol pathway
MKRLVLATVVAGLAGGGLLVAQGPAPGGGGGNAFVYKLGTFERQGRTFVGIVLRDSIVIDFATANDEVARTDALYASRDQPPRVASPRDMTDVIVRYNRGLRERADYLARTLNGLYGLARPSYIYDLQTLKTLPPVMPGAILNAAVNYRAHGEEMAARGGAGQPAQVPQGNAPSGTRSVPGLWERRPDDTRWNPYMFLKSPRAVIADGESIRLPWGRTEIDWECELGVVIGREASHVPAEKASEYIFGYTIQNDVSDRGGRGDNRLGSDWLIGKSHDTFAPLGPFIVPKEFVPDPKNLGVRFTLNGEMMQDANTSLMIHDVFELTAYGSNILTLRPGDVIGTGTPAGVGSARTPPVYFKPGDRSVCTYERIGTLTNFVVGSPAAPIETR